jgi:hypothetical protein
MPGRIRPTVRLDRASFGPNGTLLNENLFDAGRIALPRTIYSTPPDKTASRARAKQRSDKTPRKAANSVDETGEFLKEAGRFLKEAGAFLKEVGNFLKEVVGLVKEVVRFFIEAAGLVKKAGSFVRETAGFVKDAISSVNRAVSFGNESVSAVKEAVGSVNEAGRCANEVCGVAKEISRTSWRRTRTRTSDNQAAFRTSLRCLPKVVAAVRAHAMPRFSGADVTN